MPEITADAVVAANEAGGETNISTGWHAIEYLLWGQDLDPSGPGARPLTDYTTHATADRRAAYLQVVTDQLIADLDSVRAEWAPDGAYRESFLSDPDAAITNMLRGIGALSAGELAGERMAVAFETRDQEDEHSCFSDNTNADVLGNHRGVRMVYLADFPGIDGPSLSDLVQAEDAELDEALQAELDASTETIEAFPATFEAMIAAPDGDPARDAFESALVAIETQGETIAEHCRRARVVDQHRGVQPAPRRGALPRRARDARRLRRPVRRPELGRRRDDRGCVRERVLARDSRPQLGGAPRVLGREQLLQRQLGHRTGLDGGP